MAASSPFVALLHRAVLLTGVLAVIGGIFGMHIMSGAHTMPAAVSAGTDMTLIQGPHAGHGGHTAAQSPASDTPPAPASGTASGTASPASGAASPCTASGKCPTMAGMGAACVLSPANTSLSAPLPGTTSFPALNVTGAVLVAGSYSYLPESRSPGDLCISRT